MLTRIWEDLKVDEVFRFSPSDVFSLPGRLLGARKVAEQLREGQRPDRLFGLLDTRPLEKLVLGSIPWREIRTNLKSGKLEAVCIAATQIATGRAVVFVEQAERILPPWRTRRTSACRHPAPARARTGLRRDPTALSGRPRRGALLRGRRPAAQYAAGPRGPPRCEPRTGDRTLPRTQPDVSEALAQQRTEGFGSPMFLFGKILNALLLSPVDADLARMQFINTLIESGEDAFGPDFLPKLNAHTHERQGRPVQKIQSLVIRPSVDLGIIAGELLQGRRGNLEPSRFLKLFLRAFGRGDDPRRPTCSPISSSTPSLRGPSPTSATRTLRPRRSSSPPSSRPSSARSRGLPCRDARGAAEPPVAAGAHLARSRYGLGLDELAEALDCTRRTVYRDLDALMYAGFPVLSEKRDGRVSYRFLETFGLGDVPFTPDEVLALAFSEDLLRALEGTVFHDSIHSALAKIRASLGPELSSYLARLAETFRVLPGPHKRYAEYRDTIQALSDASVSQTGVRMRYRTGRTGEERWRALDPYRLWYRSGGLYVIGHDHLSEEIRTFAVDRILAIESSGEAFEVDPDFDFDEHSPLPSASSVDPPSGSASASRRSGGRTSRNTPGTPHSSCRSRPMAEPYSRCRSAVRPSCATGFCPSAREPRYSSRPLFATRSRRSWRPQPSSTASAQSSGSALFARIASPRSSVIIPSFSPLVFGALGDQTELPEVRHHGVHVGEAVQVREVRHRGEHAHGVVRVDIVLGTEHVQHVELLVRIQGLEDLEGPILHRVHLVFEASFTTRRICRTPKAAWRDSSCSTRASTSVNSGFRHSWRIMSMMPTAMPSKSVCMPRIFFCIPSAASSSSSSAFRVPPIG